MVCRWPYTNIRVTRRHKRFPPEQDPHALPGNSIIGEEKSLPKAIPSLGYWGAGNTLVLECLWRFMTAMFVWGQLLKIGFTRAGAVRRTTCDPYRGDVMASLVVIAGVPWRSMLPCSAQKPYTTQQISV